ncbi:PREDICTED: cathepsin L1-like [Dipodomys ordii]|uniref:Cathepsin L1-like n=1 Tax=Dipodomys ordii TaxID=10020 RepID=A0A1S3GNC3_DIPOR|nr:PREDICTED: cathepsin L1-like [Dipodomys ordii]
MNFLLFLAFLCLGLVVGSSKLDPRFNVQWIEWKELYQKQYGMNEEEWRRELWETNLKMIELHNEEYNRGKHSFTMAMNAFGDMTTEEFRLMMNGFQIKKHRVENIFQDSDFINIPSSIDWRERGYVVPVKHQFSCGASWAFSATGALEGQMFRKTGQLISLSEQNLVDCSWSEGNEGCNGGVMNFAFQYVIENKGLDTETSYPYEEGKGPCKYNPQHSAANVSGYMDIPKDEKILKEALAYAGPISVAIDTSPPTFLFYGTGIYFDPNCSSTDLDHGVLLVGYGFESEESDNTKYWLVKNSWGEEWGMHGYIKIARDWSNHCGIASAASFPLCEPMNIDK